MSTQISVVECLESSTGSSPAKELQYMGFEASYSPPRQSATDSIALRPLPIDMARLPMYATRDQERGDTSRGSRMPVPPTGTIRKFLYKLPELTLMDVLRDQSMRPVALSDYKHYLQTIEHGSEMLDFYLAMEELHREDNPLVLQYLIKQIVDKFIRAGSRFEINIDHVRRMRILEMLIVDPYNPNELDVAQVHCYELMRLGSFRRFLHKTTYSNIGTAEVAQRLNMAVMSFLICATLIPIALTQPWYRRIFRLFLVVPFFLFFSGIVEYMLGFCPSYAFLGARSIKSFNLYGLLPNSHTPPEKVAQSCVRRAQRRKAAILWSLCIWRLTFGLTAIIWAIPINI